WISCRTWSSNWSATLGPRTETSQKRWLTDRISAVRRCPERSSSAEPKPVMLRIIRVLRGVACGPPKVAARAARRQSARGRFAAIDRGWRRVPRRSDAARVLHRVSTLDVENMRRRMSAQTLCCLEQPNAAGASGGVGREARQGKVALARDAV